MPEAHKLSGNPPASRPSGLPASPPSFWARDSLLGGPHSNRPHCCKRCLSGKPWQCLPGGTGPPEMSGQGSKVEQRTLKIPPSTGFEGDPENTLSCHQVPPRNASGFPGSSDSKESPCDAEDPSSIPGLGRSPGEGNGNPLQCSCLGSHMDRGVWWATVVGAAESQTRLSD